MPNFAYKARAAGGRTVSGKIEASDRPEALARLKAQQLRPFALEQSSTSASVTGEEALVDKDLFAPSRWSLPRLQRSSHALGHEFCQRLLVLLQAGMAIGDAVQLLQNRVTDPQLQKLAERIWRRLSEGRSLAQGLMSEKKLLPPSLMHLIEVGEGSGNLTPILARIVGFLDEQKAVRQRMLSQLTYPLVLIAMASGVVVLLMVFLMPRIERILSQLGGELPLVTQLLLGAADLTKLYWWVPLGLIALIWGALHQWRKSTAGRLQTDLWLLQLPLIGPINRYSNLYSLTHLLGTLLSSGVNITEAMRMVDKIIVNLVYSRKFAKARKMIQEGIGLATAMREVRFFPDVTMDILSVGENTGEVVSSLGEMNRLFRERLTRELDRLTSITTVTVLTFAFILVAVIASSILLSIMGVSQTISAR